jgi:glutaredoxin 2
MTREQFKCYIYIIKHCTFCVNSKIFFGAKMK